MDPLVELVPGEMGGGFVGLVEDHDIPTRGAQPLLKVGVAGKLVEANDQLVDILEGIAAGGDGLHLPGKETELEPELLVHLVAPLQETPAARQNRVCG